MVQPKKKSARKLSQVRAQRKVVVEVCDDNPDYERVKAMKLKANGDGVFTVDGSAIQGQIEKLMRISTFEPERRYVLDTGSVDMNRVFGSAAGIPYGKVVEIAGIEHCGKTAIATVFMGMAQKDGAAAGYIDLEESRDRAWATKLGAYWDSIVKLYPKLIIPKRGKCSGCKSEIAWMQDGWKHVGPMQSSKCRASIRRKAPSAELQTAEQIFEEAEAGMDLLAKAGAKKQFWFVDSIAGIVTAKQFEVGLSDASMNSKLDRASFLSIVLPRWAGLAANYNALIFVSNQLRAKFGFGAQFDPEDTTGGRALKHACAVRVRGRRLKGGRLKQGKAIVGLAGVFRNIKNKSGDGSVEGCECGFKILWNTERASINFMPVAELEDEMGGQ